MHTHIHMHLNTYWRNEWRTSLKKVYLSLYCKGSKGVTHGFFSVRGSWRPNRTAMYWPLLWWPSTLCLFCSPGLLNRRPGGSAFWWVLAFSTTSCLWLLRSPSHWPPVFTELYNSSIAHSIFGMACLIVIKRKLLFCSSEVTLFRCISLWVYHGLLPCPISSAKSAYAISFDYWPLECVTSFRCITLEMACLAWSKVNV